MGKAIKHKAPAQKDAVDIAIERFCEIYRLGTDYTIQAAHIYYNAITDHPDARKRFAAALPKLPQEYWSSLARLGSGELHPLLMHVNCLGHRALAACDINTQVQYLSQPIQVAVIRENETRCMDMDVEKLTGKQVRQVFYKGAVRSLEEQRAWIETQKLNAAIRKAPPPPTPPPYATATHVQFGEHKLSRSDMYALLQEMDRLERLEREREKGA